MSERVGPFWDMVEGRRPPTAPAQLLGWEPLEFDPERGTGRMQFQARPEFFTPFGSIQGGILTAMLDIVLGNVVTMNLDIPKQVFSTLEIKVNFISPARVKTLIGEGHVVHKGRSIYFVEGRLLTPDGALVATATATQRVTSG